MPVCIRTAARNVEWKPAATEAATTTTAGAATVASQPAVSAQRKGERRLRSRMRQLAAAAKQRSSNNAIPVTADLDEHKNNAATSRMPVKHSKVFSVYSLEFEHCCAITPCGYTQFAFKLCGGKIRLLQSNHSNLCGS